jgi:polyhydroxyalkanoate synthesis regulator phasin
MLTLRTRRFAGKDHARGNRRVRIMAVKKAKKSTKKTKGETKKKAKKKADKWTWIDILRTPILASVGAFSIAEEGIEKFVKELVERGEASEKEGKKLVEDFRKRTKKNRKDFESGTDERIEKALKKFRLPSKKDVDSLTRKLERLEKRVDRLAKK